MAKNRKQQLAKARKHGPSSHERDRGPNTGGWEKLYGNWAPGARLKYDPDWHRGYDGSGKGTW